MKQKIRKAIEKIMVRDYHFNDDTKLFEQGFLDSMGLMLLIDFLNSEFNIKTEDGDIINKNFESVNAITKYVKQVSSFL